MLGVNGRVREKGSLAVLPFPRHQRSIHHKIGRVAPQPKQVEMDIAVHSCSSDGVQSDCNETEVLN